MGKYLQQCHVSTKPRAYSVAQEVGDRLWAFRLSCFLKSPFRNEHWCAIGSAGHAVSNDSQLSDMITDGTYPCFMLILKACFIESSQDVENNYVVKYRNIITVHSQVSVMLKVTCHRLVWSSVLNPFQANVSQLCPSFIRMTSGRTQCGNLGSCIWCIYGYLYS